jgi:hypothetical protein
MAAMFCAKSLKFTVLKFQAILDARREISLEVNAKRRKYMFMSCHQTSENYHNVNTVTKSFEIMAKLKYFLTTVTNKNCFH